MFSSRNIADRLINSLKLIFFLLPHSHLMFRLLKSTFERSYNVIHIISYFSVCCCHLLFLSFFNFSWRTNNIIVKYNLRLFIFLLQACFSSCELFQWSFNCDYFWDFVVRFNYCWFKIFNAKFWFWVAFDEFFNVALNWSFNWLCGFSFI